MSHTNAPWSQNATEYKYVFRCSLKVVSDSSVLRMLNGSSFPCARAGGSEGTVTERAVLTWYMADASLRGPQGKEREGACQSSGGFSPSES